MDSCHSEQLETMPDLRDCSAPPLSILIYWLLTWLTMTSLKKVLLALILHGPHQGYFVVCVNVLH